MPRYAWQSGTGTPVQQTINNEGSNKTGHADYTSYIKYGDSGITSGGGRFFRQDYSRIVAAGAVARALLKTIDVDIVAT